MAELAMLGGRKVLFVMAARGRVRPAFAPTLPPLMTGVGPVEAGVVIGAELGRRQADGSLPDLIVSLGSAGSRALEQTEVYQAVFVSYRDMDASPLGFEKGITPFLDLPAIVPLTLRVPGSRKPAYRPGRRSSPERAMIGSPRTWSTWRPLRCCAPARSSAFR